CAQPARLSATKSERRIVATVVCGYFVRARIVRVRNIHTRQAASERSTVQVCRVRLPAGGREAGEKPRLAARTAGRSKPSVSDGSQETNAVAGPHPKEGS